MERIEKLDMGEWTAETLEQQLRVAMGPHQKAELMVPELARLLSFLWEARQLNLKRIDDLRARVTQLEAKKGGNDKPGIHPDLLERMYS